MRLRLVAGSSVLFVLACSGSPRGATGSTAGRGGDGALDAAAADGGAGAAGTSAGGSGRSEASGGNGGGGRAGTGGLGGAGGASGAGGSAGSGGRSSGIQTKLFVDPRVPECPPGKVGAKISGTIAGQSVAFEVGTASQIGPGQFEYVTGLGLAGHPLAFEFTPRNLMPGATSQLTGDSLFVPAGQPGGGRSYCITSGEFGPVPADEQPPADNDAAFKFRIDGAYAEADCSGGKVDIDLVGCIYRTDPTIPMNYAELDTSRDAPECTPLSRRFASFFLSGVSKTCDGAALLGMPNRTHFGTNAAIPLGEPLVPGRTYAMNQWFSAPRTKSRVVAEIWGQSQACGAVDELLWVGELGDTRRYCLEFIPTKPHTHLLRVLRWLDTEGPDSLSALRLCNAGACGSTPDGRGAAPGVALQTTPGAYHYDDLIGLDGGRRFRPGLGGEFVTIYGERFVGAGFRMGPGEPYSGRWHCASSGFFREEGARAYYITANGISRMPDCSQLSGSDTLTITWNHAANSVQASSTLANFAGSDLFLVGSCYLNHCDLEIRSPGGAGTWHVLTTVDGDLGSAGAPEAAATLPIVDASFLSALDNGPLALTCGLRGTIVRDPAGTTTIKLTGLAPPSVCAGEPVTPSSNVFVLR